MPRDPGFTGVDWYARTTERLAGDLLGGAGARPLTAAAQETARLASAYGAAAVQLDRLVARLDGAVDTGRADDAARRTGPLPEYARWLARHAADLAEYAAKLSGQAAAYETAARAMPSVADAARLRTDRETAQAAAAAGGPDPALAALAGAAADSERAEQQAHGTAAAVMTGFERAAEPLRAPWEFAPPPKLEAGRGAQAKPKGAAGAGGGRGAGGGAGAPGVPLSAFPVSAVQREQGGGATRLASTAGASGAGGRGFPMMPAGMLGAAGAGAVRGTATHTPGATPSVSAGDDVGAEAFVVHAAPAVLGDLGDAVVEEL